MKSKFRSLSRFDTVIVILVFVAFSLLWISWGKLNVSGWDLPSLYKKMTKATNTILFFTQKDSPHLAYLFYLAPAFGLISLVLQFNLKRRVANFFLFLTCTWSFIISLYMYNYFLTSKVFKLANAGWGIHLLCLVSLVGFFYTIGRFRRKKHQKDRPSIDI